MGVKQSTINQSNGCGLGQTKRSQFKSPIRDELTES